MSIVKAWNRRKTQLSTWLGLSALLTAGSHFLAGAGETTPAALEEGARAAENVGNAIAQGIDPVTAILMGALGAVAAFSDTKEGGHYAP